MSQRYRKATRATQPTRPEPGLFVSGRRDDFWADTTAKRLTPARLGRILRDAEAGQIAQQAEVFDKIEEDPQIMTVYGKRKRAALTKTLQITPGDETDRAKAAAELCEEVIAGIPGWRAARFHLLDAIGRAFSAAQIVWDYRAGRFVIRKLQWWKQRDFAIDEDDLDEIRILTDSNASKGEALEPFQWVVHRCKARTGHLGEASLFRGLCWAYMFKHFSWKDWVIFSEAYGMPRRVGTYPRGASDEEKRMVVRAVQQLGRDGAVAIPEGAALEFVKAETAKSELPFPSLITLSDRYASKLILGQTLTTEEGERGARSLGDVHKDVEDDLIESDCADMAETIRDQICKPVIGFNLGWDVPLPKVEFLIDEDEDLKLRAERDKILAVDMNVPMSLKQIRETYDLLPPEDEEDTLQVPRGNVQQMEQAISKLDIFRLAALSAAEKKRSMTWGSSTD